MSPVASTRWCPTPEQVMILEEMYRSGVRTPNASHIQQITAHLSLYGKIEGKNVFYWFQNHKARDRQKLRKRLLGKQVQYHQHHNNNFDQMIQIPSIVVDQHNFHQQPPLFNNHQQQVHHFDQLPCCASSTILGFHQPSPFVNTPCFATSHQPRLEDTFARMTNDCTWKGETTQAKFGLESEKTAMRNPNNDWMMIKDHDYEHHYDYHDVGDDDNDNNEDDFSKRPIKTLELFPIKDKTSLKENVDVCAQPNTTNLSINNL